MTDKFFTQQNCDRCGVSLANGRTMSRFNTSCICMRCAESERQRPGYQKAVEAEQAEIRNGNFNFKGIDYSCKKAGKNE